MEVKKIDSSKNLKPGPLLPRLMINEDGDLIILVKRIQNDHLIGTVIYTDTNDYPLGSYSERWNLKAFKDYCGTITLTT